MNILVISARRSIAFAAAVALAGLTASAAPAADRAAEQLAVNGSVPVKAAGPYVEIGTFQIQVAAKLGRPNAKLADGTWLYDHRTIEGSQAEGTLVVRFSGGRVSGLSFVTPAVALAMTSRRVPADRTAVAARN